MSYICGHVHAAGFICCVFLSVILKLPTSSPSLSLSLSLSTVPPPPAAQLSHVCVAQRDTGCTGAAAAHVICAPGGRHTVCVCVCVSWCCLPSLRCCSSVCRCVSWGSRGRRSVCFHVCCDDRRLSVCCRVSEKLRFLGVSQGIYFLHLHLYIHGFFF